MGIGITELSNGLYQVKQQGEPARVFYTQEQAEKFAKKFSSGTNIQTVTYKQLQNGKYQVTLPNGKTTILNDTKVLENYAKKHGFTLQNATNLQPLAQDTVQITNNKAGLQPVRTYTKYAQEHGVTYHKPPKSGVVKADEIAAQQIAENAKKQAVQHTRQRYAAGVVDTYTGGTLEELRNVEPLGNRAPELSQPVPKPAPQPTPKSTTKIPQGTTVTPQPHIPNGNTTTTASVPLSVSPKNAQIYPHANGETYAQMLGKPTPTVANDLKIDYHILEKNNTAGQVVETAKERAREIGESAEGWWKSLKASVEKNPTKWGLGAAGVALGLWVLSSSDKKQNV